MARPRRGKKRRDQRDGMHEYLITGVRPIDNPFFSLRRATRTGEADSPELREAWEQSGIMKEWNRPGLRPWAWWRFDAPREILPGLHGTRTYEGYPAPRLHISGPGLPLHEDCNWMPKQLFGIYDWSGDPDNPPIFETQFAYLVRHGLLLPDETEPMTEPHTRPEFMRDKARWDSYRTR